LSSLERSNFAPNAYLAVEHRRRFRVPIQIHGQSDHAVAGIGIGDVENGQRVSKKTPSPSMRRAGAFAIMGCVVAAGTVVGDDGVVVGAGFVVGVGAGMG